ncbi:hypothetical protein F1559_000261 [Cyanidiococcus yangmingshanensis]|uniref:Uncharacterized protein n=1 Tax=Cyanidiococcus yangmingshanensis TaxID=2690220 RepID=A0A7J7IDI2_9RHOD|nr:hypothetical protein F1559_000261 [Cyanidiococcus yangmingshanensis]
MSRWNWDKVRRLQQKWIATWYDASDRTKRRLLVVGVALLCVLWFVGGSLQPSNRFKGLPQVDSGSATSRDWPDGSSSSSSSGTMTRDSPPDQALGRDEAPKPWTEAELTELAKVWIGIEDALCSAHEVYKKHAQGGDNDEERQIRGHANAWRSFMAAVPPPPVSRRPQRRKEALEPATRAIVLPAGGPGLLQLGLVSLQALRYRARCSLPVEVFYQDAGEAPSPELEAWVAKALGPVVFRDISQVAQRAYKMRQNGDAALQHWHASCPHQLRIEGYGLKVFAMVLSAYDEILVLDSDNLPLLDPTGLFSMGPFGRGEIGGFFWTDFFGIFGASDYQRSVLYRTMLRHLEPPPCAQHDGTVEYQEPGTDAPACGVPVHDQRGLESGQVLIRRRQVGQKRSFWRALMLSVYMYHHRDFFYRHMYGDKDSYRLAALALREPSEICPIALGSVGFYDDHQAFQGHGMLQFWPFPETLAQVPALMEDPAELQQALLRQARMGRTVLFLHRNQRKIPVEGPRVLKKQHFNLKVSCWNNATGDQAREPPRFFITPEQGLTRLTGPDIVCVNTHDLVGFDVDADVLNYVENLWDRREWRSYLHSRNIY